MIREDGDYLTNPPCYTHSCSLRWLYEKIDQVDAIRWDSSDSIFLSHCNHYNFTIWFSNRKSPRLLFTLDSFFFVPASSLLLYQSRTTGRTTRGISTWNNNPLPACLARPPSPLRNGRKWYISCCSCVLWVRVLFYYFIFFFFGHWRGRLSTTLPVTHTAIAGQVRRTQSHSLGSVDSCWKDIASRKQKTNWDQMLMIIRAKKQGSLNSFVWMGMNEEKGREENQSQISVISNVVVINNGS